MNDIDIAGEDAATARAQAGPLGMLRRVVKLSGKSAHPFYLGLGLRFLERALALGPFLAQDIELCGRQQAAPFGFAVLDREGAPGAGRSGAAAACGWPSTAR